MDCIGLFCEDIRDEVSGSHSIVGVMPDNINLQGPENQKPDAKLLLPKLGFYIRANFAVEQRVPQRIAAEAAIPGHEVIKLGALEAEAIQKAFAEAANNNLPLVGVIFKAVVSPIPLSESGIAILRIVVDSQEQICGSLNIRIMD